MDYKRFKNNPDYGKCSRDNHSPQGLGTRHFALQHITHCNSHGLVADTLVIVFAVPWMSFLANR